MKRMSMSPAREHMGEARAPGVCWSRRAGVGTWLGAGAAAGEAGEDRDPWRSCMHNDQLRSFGCALQVRS